MSRVHSAYISSQGSQYTHKAGTHTKTLHSINICCETSVSNPLRNVQCVLWAVSNKVTKIE